MAPENYLITAGRVGGDKSSYVALVRSPATVPENCLMICDNSVAYGGPSEGVDVVSSSFPSFNEPRFIEPVGL